MFGFWVGLTFGLPLTIISQYINLWILPQVPFFDPPLGRITVVVLGSLGMGLFGMIVAWDEESLWGLIGAGLFGVAMTSVSAYLNSGITDLLRSFIVFVFTFLPRLIIYLPLGLLFRWVINHQEYIHARSKGWMRRSVMIWTVLVGVAVLGGLYSIQPEESRISLAKAEELLQEGMAIEDRMSLPRELIPVEGFVEYAEGPYTLELSREVDSLPVTRPRVEVGVIESLVIYRFENGFQFGCVFTPPSYVANCVDIHVP
jgi:fluoride ion exporter CrcB/FEX